MRITYHQIDEIVDTIYKGRYLAYQNVDECLELRRVLQAASMVLFTGYYED